MIAATGRRLTAGAEGYDGLVAALGQLGRDDGHEGLERLGVRLNVAPLKGGMAGGRVHVERAYVSRWRM